jgi:protein ImuB
MGARRIAAVVLPELACELVRQKVEARGPLAVILEPAALLAQGEHRPILGAASLDAVDVEARRYGVRAGQRVSEAAALVARLAIHRLSFEELDAALARGAEVAMSLGTTAATRLAAASLTERGAPLPRDTVWLDVTGAAHLVGGEEALLDELASRLEALGHRTRAAIASGPQIAAAIARWGSPLLGGRLARTVVPIEDEATKLANLPVHALPLDPDVSVWLVRLGVISVGDLVRLPRGEVLARLGARGKQALDLALGRDDVPLVPYAPPRLIEEEASFEESVDGTEALLFVLRGLVSRASARLAARGEACTRLELTIPFDRSIARAKLVELGDTSRGDDDDAMRLALAVDLPAPLSREVDLLRALKAKLERAALFAPAAGVRLTLPQIVPAPAVPLDLSRSTAVDPDNLPALLAELSAEIGPERVGVLSLSDAHRLEARSLLVPAQTAPREAAPVLTPGAEPTRLLVDPAPIGRVARGGVVAVGKHLFAIEQVRFAMRLDLVEWWTGTTVSRDYVRAWLASGAGERPAFGIVRDEARTPSSGEAWLYVDRDTGEGYFQGWRE